MSKPKIEYSETSWMLELASMEGYATELESKNKALAKICDKQEQEIKELKFTLEDWQESHNIIINEECSSDEKHCTCVPALRKHIEQLEKREKKKNNEYNGANSSE